MVASAMLRNLRPSARSSTTRMSLTPRSFSPCTMLLPIIPAPPVTRIKTGAPHHGGQQRSRSRSEGKLSRGKRGLHERIGKLQAAEFPIEAALAQQLFVAAALDDAPL